MWLFLHFQKFTISRETSQQGPDTAQCKNVSRGHCENRCWETTEKPQVCNFSTQNFKRTLRKHLNFSARDKRSNHQDSYFQALMILHLHQDLNCGKILIKSYLYYSKKSSNTSGPRNWTHANAQNPSSCKRKALPGKGCCFPCLYITALSRTKEPECNTRYSHAKGPRLSENPPVSSASPERFQFKS